MSIKNDESLFEEAGEKKNKDKVNFQVRLIYKAPSVSIPKKKETKDESLMLCTDN